MKSDLPNYFKDINDDEICNKNSEENSSYKIETEYSDSFDDDFNNSSSNDSKESEDKTRLSKTCKK